MTVVTDPYSILADAVEAAINTEFADVPHLVVRHDYIHESLGGDQGRTYVGISPDGEQPVAGTDLMIDLRVQFYGPYKKEVNPSQQVDPRAITNKAERMRRALGAIRTTAGNAQVWFFDVGRVSYPHDPTGNKTRFEMVVTGRGYNSGLIETTG